MAIRLKQRQLALAGLVAVALITVAALIAWMSPASRPAEVVPLKPRAAAVVPGVYYLGRTEPAAVYAVDSSDGFVLIDTGLDERVASITSQLAELKLDVGRLRAILLTHVHADHSLGAARLRAQTGAKVYAGAADCKPLREGNPREAFFSTFHMPGIPTHPTPVDVELKGGETISIGDAHFEAIAAPGHTPGSICYLLDLRGTRTLFTGDVVQSLNRANPDVLGTYAAYLAPVYRGNARDYLATLQRLRVMPLPDLILPGHPRMDPVPQSPRLPPERWNALLNQGITEMERLLERRAADGADFLDGAAKELLPNLHYLGSLQGRAVYALKTPKDFYLFNTPGGPGLVDLVAEHARRLKWEIEKPTAVLLTSADPAALTGLTALLQKTGCKVVAPKSAREAIQKACPGADLLTEDDLGQRGWFDVTVIPLEGRGAASLAYQVKSAGKVVLITGNIPTKLGGPATEQLLRDVHGAGGDPTQFQESLLRLRKLSPDMWLPALPVHGQNANLYDNDWEEVLRRNWQLVAR